MTATPLNFLVIDHHRDSRFLLVKSLLRKFPRAVIIEAEAGEHALKLARRRDLAIVVTHRTQEFIGTELVAQLRAINPDVLIVMVSGIERTAPALAAGADAFLLYDEWLRIGSVVKQLLDRGRTHREVIPEDPLPKIEPAEPN
jgi:DNA-binding NarL/FixJ family response regulator